MFLALTKLELGAAALRMHVALHPRLLIVTIERTVYDTRLVAAGEPLLAGGLLIYLVLEGRVVWHDTAEVFEAPSCLVLRDEDFEGAGGPGHPTFRTDSARFRAIEVRVDASCGVPSVPRPLDSATREAAETYWRAALQTSAPSGEPMAGPTNDLLGALLRVGLVVGLDDIDLSIEEPRHLEVLWEAVASIFENIDLGTTQNMVADQSLLSTRQVHRDVGEILGRLRLPAKGWRDALRAWRLRLAIVLLSADGVSIAGVAKAVGYARAEAMANAFQAAGLPTPFAIRRSLQAAAVDGPRSTES